MAGATAGVVGQAEVNAPQGTPISQPKTAAFWSWVWLGVCGIIILGFHIRVFGATIPPIAVSP